MVRGWALGLLGIKPAELDLLEPAVFWAALKAHTEERDADRRHIGELIRGIAARLLNVQLKRPITDVRSFWPMPWDEERTQAGMQLPTTKEEIERAAADFMEKLKK